MTDSRALRDAFGCFATGITVVTSFDSARKPVGFTANSFTSVSLDPPLLLVCPGKKVSALPAILESRVFGVNVLAADQEHVSRRFTMPGVDRFAEAQWVEAENGVLLLEGAVTNFACRIENEVDAGDHLLLIGRIESFRAACERQPLMYVKGAYA